MLILKDITFFVLQNYVQICLYSEQKFEMWIKIENHYFELFSNTPLKLKQFKNK